MNRDLLIFKEFFKRDLYAFSKYKITYFINYSLIFPALFSLTFGYIIPFTAFNQNVLPSTGFLLASSVVFLFLIFPVSQNIFLLLDLENEKYVEYQATLLNPKYIILEKILFSSLFTFLIVIPFFFVSKLILGDIFDVSKLSVIKLLITLFLASCMASSYVIFCLLKMKNPSKMGMWWRRVNTPLFMLGGAWVPWLIMAKVSVFLGYITLLNPFLYVTESLRGAILGPEKFIHFHYCVVALIIFTLIFTHLSLKTFKKRIDCF